MSNPISISPAVAADTRIRHGLSRAWHRFVASAPVARAAAFVARVVAERRLRRATAHLSALDDRLLRDIGIDRAMIACAVRDGRSADASRHDAGASFSHT